MINVENSKIQNPLPFRVFCQKVIPLAFDESMSYLELLYALLHYLKETVIPAVNNNADAIEELQNLYVELKNYVDNYFDNLDVQDEINNKLDEMATDGTLQEIITAYLNVKGILAYNTVAEMKASTNLVDGSFVKTYGKLVYNDGLGEFYKVRQIINTDVVDEINIIALNNPNLVAELMKNQTIEDIQTKISKIENDWLDPLNYGAKGDGVTDDYQVIQNCINQGNVRLSKGSYYLSQPISIPSDRVFDGGNRTLIPAESQYAISLLGNGINQPVTQVQIQNIKINATAHGGNGIYIKDTYFVYIDNVNIIRLSKNDAIGFNVLNGFNHVITNSRVYGNKDYTGQIGLNIVTSGDQIANATNNIYDTLLLQNLAYGVKTNYTVSANMIEFNNIGFSNNDYGFYIDGYALPLTIKNTRMEYGQNEGIGFYIGANAEVSIDTFNAYNIPKVIKTISTRTLLLQGAIALTGTNQSPTYRFVDPDSTGVIMNLASVVSLSNVYNDGYSNMVNTKRGGIGIATITGNNVNLSNTNRGVYEITGTTSLLNIFGKKNSEAYIWTKQSGLVIFGSANSTTNKWSGSITLEPYKIYHVLAVDDNQIAIFN